jgi:hypothetical protein
LSHRLRLSVSQTINRYFTTVIIDLIKQQNKKSGLRGIQSQMSSSGIMAEEPQHNPVLAFSITLTQKRVRPTVWIILVLHAELASVRALLVKGLDPSNLPSTLELVYDVPSLLHARTQTKFRKCNTSSHEHISRSRAHTHTHTRKHQHSNICTRHLQSLEDNVLRHILQRRSWVCLIIPDR